jgi:hypothetical protein
MARIVLEGVWGTDGNLRRGKSELAGATVERVLTAGAYDRRWRACTTPSATIEGRLDVWRVECINCERKNIRFGSCVTSIAGPHGGMQLYDYRRTGNLRAVQLLLGHTKIESTVRYLGIEVDDAIAIAEQVDV